MKGCICQFTKWQIHPFIYPRCRCASYNINLLISNKQADLSHFTVIPATTIHWPNAGWMLARRLRRQPNWVNVSCLLGILCHFTCEMWGLVFSRLLSAETMCSRWFDGLQDPSQWSARPEAPQGGSPPGLWLYLAFFCYLRYKHKEITQFIP